MIISKINWLNTQQLKRKPINFNLSAKNGKKILQKKLIKSKNSNNLLTKRKYKIKKNNSITHLSKTINGAKP